MIKVALGQPESANDVPFVAALSKLINQAYASAESGLWREAIGRTSAEEVSSRLGGGEVVVALENNRSVGCVFTRQIDDRTGWFGALAVDPQQSGRGIGRAMVSFCEEQAWQARSIRMQLEVLAPRPAHPHTTRLAHWYQQLGYSETERVPLGDCEPELAAFLLGDCDLATFHKQLVH